MDELNAAINTLADSVNSLEVKIGANPSPATDMTPAITAINELNKHIAALLAKLP